MVLLESITTLISEEVRMSVTTSKGLTIAQAAKLLKVSPATI